MLFYRQPLSAFELVVIQRERNVRSIVEWGWCGRNVSLWIFVAIVVLCDLSKSSTLHALCKQLSTLFTVTIFWHFVVAHAYSEPETS